MLRFLLEAAHRCPRCGGGRIGIVPRARSRRGGRRKGLHRSVSVGPVVPELSIKMITTCTYTEFQTHQFEPILYNVFQSTLSVVDEGVADESGVIDRASVFCGCESGACT
jgi:hypothetical protein